MADFFLKIFIGSVAADAEQLQNLLDGGGLLFILCIVIFFFAQGRFLHCAALPFEQAADFAFQAAAGDIRLAANRMFDNFVVDAADVDFAVAAADVQAGF